MKTTPFEIRDASGAVVALHVRRDLEDGSKTYAWKRPDGRIGLGGVAVASLPLYRLPELLAAPADGLVVVVEGERKCDKLNEVGVLAVASVTGASGTPSDDVLRPLVGRSVYLWPDHDEKGREHMNRICASLARLGVAPRFINWSEARDPGDDAGDYLARGGTAEGVRALMASAKEWTPGTPEQTEPAPTMEPVTIHLSDVKAVPVRWLWPGRVPLGKLTVLDGDPGLGKSLVTLDLAARVSTGREMPDGSRGDLAEPAGVVLLSAEDDPADTIRPRLDAAGGDAAHVVALLAVRSTTAKDGVPRTRERSVTLDDLPALRAAIGKTRAVLVVVDPFMAYLGGATDGHKDAEIRSLLAPLAALAPETGAAILLVRHLRKSGGANPLYAGGGSIGIIGAARSGLMVARDPDDADGQRRVLCSTKCNLSVEPESLSYGIEAPEGEPRVQWRGPSAHTAASIMATAPEDAEKRGARADAEGFLRGLLAVGPRPEEEVESEAKSAGISMSTVKRAKAVLGVRSRKNGFGGGWLWSLPDAPGKELGPLGPLRPNGPETPENGPSAEEDQPAHLVPLGKQPPNGQMDAVLPKKTKEINSGAGGLRPCGACKGVRFWRSVHSVVLCAECHPPASDELVAERLQGGEA